MGKSVVKRWFDVSCCSFESVTQWGRLLLFLNVQKRTDPDMARGKLNFYLYFRKLLSVLLFMKLLFRDIETGSLPLDLLSNVSAYAAEAIINDDDLISLSHYWWKQWDYQIFFNRVYQRNIKTFSDIQNTKKFVIIYYVDLERKTAISRKSTQRCIIVFF